MAEPARAPVEVVDTRWGRRPGARPPIPVWAPAAFAIVLGLLLTLVVVLVIRPPGPLDQASPTEQRDGLLDNGPTVAAAVNGVTFGDSTVVLLFVRDEAPDAEVLSRWVAALSSQTQVVVVVAVQGTDPDVTTTAREQVVADRDEVLAAAVALPVPVDGGPGIGYAVVGSGRVVRYSTLDPAWAHNGFEVATIVGATP